MKIYSCFNSFIDIIIFTLEGLDIIKHKEPAYPLISYGHGWKELFTPEEMRFLLFPTVCKMQHTKTQNSFHLKIMCSSRNRNERLSAKQL